MEDENFFKHTPRSRLYTIEDARDAYEQIREIKRKELEIQFVQERVKNKILGVNEEYIELNFYKQEEEQELEEMSSILSEENNKIIESSSGDPLKTESSVAETEEIDDSFDKEDSIARPKNEDKSNRSRGKISRFLDLEAEYSGTEEDEEDGEAAELEDLVDLDCMENDTNAANIFYEEKNKEDKKQLLNLKRKFSQLKKTAEVKKEHVAYGYESSEDLSSEIEELDLDFVERSERPIELRQAEVETVKQVKPLEIKKESLFNENSDVLGKLNKKNETKGFGFKEC